MRRQAAGAWRVALGDHQSGKWSPLSEAQAEILDSWGIRKCRDLALLLPVPLVERLGQSGLHLQRLARGEVSRTLVPVDPPLRFEESLECEDAVEDLGPAEHLRACYEAGPTGYVLYWQLDTDTWTARRQGVHEDVGCPQVAFSPDGKLLAEAYYNVVRMFDTASLRLMRTFGEFAPEAE